MFQRRGHLAALIQSITWIGRGPQR
jgi:hypothetical protein